MAILRYDGMVVYEFGCLQSSFSSLSDLDIVGRDEGDGKAVPSSYEVDVHEHGLSGKGDPVPDPVG